MTKFNYRLETLLNIKIQKDDLIKIKLAAELKKMEVEIQKLELLTYKNKKQINDYITLINTGVSVNKIRYCHGYICQLSKMIDQQKKNINIIAENVDKIRGELNIESQERKALEKLKEKKVEAYRKKILKEEQKRNDEIISFNQNTVLAVER